MGKNKKKKEQSDGSRSLYDGFVAMFGYSCMVFVFIVLTLSAFLSPAIDEKVSAKVDSARESIKSEYASMQNVALEYIHFRRENDQYYVWASNGEEILVTSTMLKEALANTGIVSDAKISAPGETVAFAFASAGVFIYLAFALIKRRREETRNDFFVTATKFAVMANYTESKRRQSY